MGKSRPRKRLSGARKTPFGSAATSATENGADEEDLVADEDVLRRISTQLQSASSEERECGCASLSLMAGTSQAAEVVLDRRLVRIVAPLLLDTDVSVRHAAVGALKNLSLVSVEVCDQMVQQDVMTPLCELLAAYGGQTWAVAKHSSDTMDQRKEIFIEAIDLLWNLCEANEVALKIFNEKNALDLLMGHTDVGILGPRAVASVLQCVYAVSEDNKNVVEALEKHQNTLDGFRRREANNASELHLQILANGITLNATKCTGGNVESLLPSIVECISKVLGQDQRKLIHDYSSAIPLANGENNPAEAVDAMVTEDKARYEVLREDIKSVILAQQAAMEMLANVCCDETEEWEMDSNMSEDESVDEDNQSLGSADVMQPSPTIPTVLQEAILEQDLVSKVLAKANLPAENVVEILKGPGGRRCEGPVVLKMASTLRSRAFLCLNNLIDALSLEDLGGSEALFKVWSSLGQLCFNSGTEDELVEAATSAMRAATQKLLDSSQFDSLTQEDLDKMVAFGAAHSDSSVRTNIVHIAGNIGQIGSKRLQESAQAKGTIKTVAHFLTEAATKDTDLRVVAEALDKTFDIFAEDHTDQLCQELGLVSKLKQILPGLKVKINVQRQHKGQQDVAALAAMAKTNLTRFVKYKEKYHSRNGHK